MATEIKSIIVEQNTQINIKVLAIRNTKILDITESLAPYQSLTTPHATILDMSLTSSMESPAWFRKIRSLLKQYNLTLIGVRNPQMNLEVCKALKIPVLDMENATATSIKRFGSSCNIYINRPVRTGQQIFSDKGSLIITSGVSNGAEVAAIDDVHIYGPANGKILAGVKGNESARIYISSGFPEMISINSHLITGETLRPIRRLTQFFIKDGQLVQEPL